MTMKRRSSRSMAPVIVIALFSATLMAGRSQPARPTAGTSLSQLAKELQPEYGPVRFHREEEFEDRLQTTDMRKGQPPKVYVVQGAQIDDPNYLPTMYLATLNDGKAVYRLGGFEGAAENFRRLLRDAGIKHVGGKQHAESRGLLCADIVYGLSPNWWLGGAGSVKLEVARHFFAAGSEDGLMQAERWWESAKGDRDRLSIVTMLNKGLYSVDVPIFWAPVEGSSVPEVRVYRIVVDADGSCRMPEPYTTVLR
jgi:hypothetical protein